MIYRIYTEDQEDEEYLSGLVLRRFEGFTISKGTGYYKGRKQRTLCIEIDTLGDDNRAGVYQLALDIKYSGCQEAVLLQIVGIKSILV